MNRLCRLPHLAPTLLLRSPLHRLMSRRFLLLSYQGRRTGQDHTLPVAYFRRGDQLLVTTDSPWWRNFTTPTPVSVRLAGRDVEGTAIAIGDPKEVADALSALIAAQPSYARFAEVELLADGMPDPTSLRQAAAARTLVRVTCAPSGHPSGQPDHRP